MLQGHGDDGYKYKQEIKANFSTNIWFGGYSNELKEYLINKWNTINSYPEASAESFVKALSMDLQVDTNMLMAVNGATEAFYLIAQSYHGKSSSIVIPTFSEYEDACKINDHSLSFIDWKNLSSTTTFTTDLVWICNPNNPTGEILLKDDICKLLENNPNCDFVIDEAYIDFTDAISSSIDLIKEYKNLIIVKSLTKNFAIPGLRLGYLISNKDIVQNIEFYKAPWTVNSLAIEAGKYLLKHKSQILPPVNNYKSSVEKFHRKLNEIPSIIIHPTKTSYFLVELEKSNSKELKNYLISNFGILIRDASNFRGLNSSYIRVACLEDEKNQLLIDALHIWSKSH